MLRLLESHVSGGVRSAFATCLLLPLGRYFSIVYIRNIPYGSLCT